MGIRSVEKETEVAEAPAPQGEVVAPEEPAEAPDAVPDPEAPEPVPDPEVPEPVPVLKPLPFVVPLLEQAAADVIAAIAAKGRMLEIAPRI